MLSGKQLFAVVFSGRLHIVKSEDDSIQMHSIALYDYGATINSNSTEKVSKKVAEKLDQISKK